nr:hypothetical protein [Candidimonas sp. SYP-B2681]
MNCNPEDIFAQIEQAGFSPEEYRTRYRAGPRQNVARPCLCL